MSRAFTLIEIMLVIAILAILSALALPSFRAYRQASQHRACEANLKMLNSASEALIMRDNLPTSTEITLDMLIPSSTTDRSKAFILTPPPSCPNHGTYKYSVSTRSWTCEGGNH